LQADRVWIERYRGRLPVPLSYELYDGNRADVTTHIPNWEKLRALLGREDFIYVADSKLCSYENLCTIAENGGWFIAIVPRNFREVKDFLAKVRVGEDIEWHDEISVPDSRKKGATQDYRIHVGEGRQETVSGFCGFTARPRSALKGATVSDVSPRRSRHWRSSPAS
jgi:hypothetical protein